VTTAATTGQRVQSGGSANVISLQRGAEVPYDDNAELPQSVRDHALEERHSLES
jgi:hypothetical protein